MLKFGIFWYTKKPTSNKAAKVPAARLVVRRLVPNTWARRFLGFFAKCWLASCERAFFKALVTSFSEALIGDGGCAGAGAVLCAA